MRKIILTVTLLVMLLSLFGCEKNDPYANLTGRYEYLDSKLENSLELQKSLFLAKVTSVTEKQALIPKYNIDITDYCVYTVEITESFDGVTPTGTALVYWIGAADEFLTRVGLEKNGAYILDAEPWVYGEEIIYLLAPYTTSFPRLDSSGRVTLAENEKDAKDCGTLEDYRKSIAEAKNSLSEKYPDFFKTENILARYKEMFENIKTVTDKNWFREFDYEFIPSDEFISKTRAFADKTLTLVQNAKTLEDITQIFTYQK